MTVRPRHTARDKAREIGELTQHIGEYVGPMVVGLVKQVPPIVLSNVRVILARRYRDPR